MTGRHGGDRQFLFLAISNLLAPSGLGAHVMWVMAVGVAESIDEVRSQGRL